MLMFIFIMQHIQEKTDSILENQNKARRNITVNVQNIKSINQIDLAANMTEKNRQELKKLSTIKQSVMRLIASFPSQDLSNFMLQWNKTHRQNIVRIYRTQVTPYFGYSYSEIGTQSKNQYQLVNIIQMLHILSFRVQVPVSQEQFSELGVQQSIKAQSTGSMFPQGNTRLPAVGRAYYISSFIFNKVSTRAQQIDLNFSQANHRQFQTICFLLALSIQFYICCLHFQIWAALLEAYQDPKDENTRFKIALKFQTDLFIELCLKQENFWGVIMSTISSSDDMTTFQLIMNGENDKQSRQFLRSFKIMLAMYEMQSQSEKIKQTLYQIASKSQIYIQKKIEYQKKNIEKTLKALKQGTIRLKQTQISLKSDKNFLQTHHPNRRAQVIAGRLSYVSKNISQAEKKKEEMMLQSVFQINKRRRYKHTSKRILQSVVFDMNQISLCLVATVPKIFHKIDKINFLMRSILQNVDVQRKFISTGIYQQLNTTQEQALSTLLKKDQRKKLYKANHFPIAFTKDMFVFLQREPQNSGFVDFDEVAAKFQFNQAILVGSKVFDKKINGIIKTSLKKILKNSSGTDFKTLIKRLNQQVSSEFQTTLEAAIDKHLQQQYPFLKQNNSKVDIKQIADVYQKSQSVQKLVFLQLIQQTVVSNLKAVIQAVQAKQLKKVVYNGNVEMSQQQIDSFFESSLASVRDGIRYLSQANVRPAGLQISMFSIISYTRSVVTLLESKNYKFAKKLSQQLKTLFNSMKKYVSDNDLLNTNIDQFAKERVAQMIEYRNKISKQIQGRDPNSRIVINIDSKIDPNSIKEVFIMEQQPNDPQNDKIDKQPAEDMKEPIKEPSLEGPKKIPGDQPSNQQPKQPQDAHKSLTEEQLLKKQKKKQMYPVNGKTALMSNSASEGQMRQIVQILQNLSPYSQKQRLFELRQSIQKNDQQMLKNTMWKNEAKFEQHMSASQFSVVIELQYLIMQAYLEKLDKMQKIQLRTSFINQIKNHAETTESDLNNLLKKIKETDRKIKQLVKKNQSDYKVIEGKRKIRMQYQNSTSKLAMQGVSLHNIMKNVQQPQGFFQKSLSFIAKVVKSAPSTAVVRGKTSYMRALQTQIQALQGFIKELDEIRIQNQYDQQDKRLKQAQKIVQQISKQQRSIEKQLTMYSFSTMLNLEDVNDTRAMILQNMPRQEYAKLQQIIKIREKQQQQRQQERKNKKLLQDQTIKKQKQLIIATQQLENQRIRANYDLYHQIQRKLRVQQASEKKQMIQKDIHQKKRILQAKNEQLKAKLDNSEKVISNALSLNQDHQQFETTAKKMYTYVMKKPVIFELIFKRTAAHLKKIKKDSFYLPRFLQYVEQNAKKQNTQLLKNVADLDKQYTLIQSKYTQKTEMIKTQQASITLMVNQVHQRLIQIKRLQQTISSDNKQIFALKQKYTSLSVKLNLFLFQKKSGQLQKDIRSLEAVINQAVQKRQMVMQKIQLMFSLKQLFQQHQALINQTDAQNPRLIQIRAKVNGARQQVMKGRQYLDNQLKPIQEQIRTKINSVFSLISQQQRKKKKILAKSVQDAYRALTQKINTLFKTQQLLGQELIKQHATKMTTQILTDFYQKQRVQKMKSDSKNLASSIESKLRTIKQQIIQVQQKDILLDSVGQNFKKKLQTYKNSFLRSANIVSKEQGDAFLEQLMTLIKMNDRQVNKRMGQRQYSQYVFQF